MTVWLLTWLWQGTAVTLLAAVLLQMKRTNASTRYLVWWGALLAVVWLGYTSSPYRSMELPSVPVQGSYSNDTESAREPYLPVPEASPFQVSVLLGIWAAVALLRLVRLLPGLHAIYALRDRCRAFPAEMESRLTLWREARSHGRRAELLVCDAVPGATVLGFQRPSIAIPPSLVEALDADELDQIVLHEHAHVRRWDDWARLAQGLLQAVLWIHPAVALIGRALNSEREMACDEQVVARTGLPKAYARCLARAAEVRSGVRVAPMLGPAFFGREHHLVRRVNRVLGLKGKTRCRVSPLAVTAAACVITGVSAQLKAIPLIGAQAELILPQVAQAATEWRLVQGRRADDHWQTADSAAPVPEPTRQSNIPNAAAPGRTDATASPASIAPGAVAATAPVPSAVAAPAGESSSEPTASLQARSYEGDYAVPNPISTSGDQPGKWRAAATPGVEIANAARKASVGLASAFARAGASLGRSF